MIILVLILFLNATTPVVYAENTSETYYAQIMFEQVYLYKTPTNDNSTLNVYFEIPKTYFVELLENANESFYYAKYSNIFGYVKKASVQAVSNTPNSPFLDNLKFRVYADLSRNMQTEPNLSSNTSSLVASVPLYSRNLTFYGKIIGENLIEGRTNIWYYCKYTVTNECGYVYSDACDKMDNIVKNTEKLPYISTPQWNLTPTQSPQLVAIDSNPFKITVILICIPFIVFGIILLRWAYTKKGNKKEIDTFNPFD